MVVLILIGIIYLATKKVTLTDDDYGFTFENDNK
jgi:hypothetical protein